MFHYTVRCSFEDPQVARNWLTWLENEHIADVIKAGAKSGEIFRVDNAEVYEIRYLFSSEGEFHQYEENHAPNLRDEGLKKFPLSLGLTYSRSTRTSLFRMES